MPFICEKTLLKAASKLLIATSREFFSTKSRLLWEKFNPDNLKSKPMASDQLSVAAQKTIALKLIVEDNFADRTKLVVQIKRL